MALKLTLIGQPAVYSADGQPADPQPGAKPLALLAYLCLEPGSHTREELAALLWGESPEAEARASLRQALRQLRSYLGALLRTDRSSVELSGLECDVSEFRRLAEEDPRQAPSLDVSRFLAGFSVRQAPRFDEWVAQTRSALLRSWHQSLASLAREAMAQWRWREAAQYADRWLGTEPLSDEAMRLAIEAHYLAGDRGAALARFAEYRSTLKRETGCDPGRALLSLVQRVQADAENSSGRGPVTDEWYARGPAFESSLIGREGEWEVLLRAWHEVRRGTGRIIIVEGEPGVGKSRLAQESVHWVVAAGGGTALRGRAYDGRAGVAYEPVVEMLRTALPAPGLSGTAPEWLAEVARLCPELHQRFPALPAPIIMADSAQSWRLYEGVVQLVLSLAAEHPTIISVDDLQWCDEDSLRLLRFLVRRTERAPVLWVMAVNTGELDRDSSSARFCRTLRAKPHTEVITPAPLSAEELRLMIRQMGHLSTPDGARRFAQRLYDVTGGNPFYTIELLKTMFSRGLLAVNGETGEWIASGVVAGKRQEFPISRNVHDVITERVERLPEPLREALVTVAVAGSAVSAEILSSVNDVPRLHAAALGDALVERRLVVQESGGYRAGHPVIGRVVRDRLTPVRRREIHRTLALALEARASSAQWRGSAGEIARHADLGGECPMAYRFALIACEAAMERYAYNEALSWLEVASRNASGGDAANEVKRIRTEVLQAAGLNQAPAAAPLGGPITRGLEEQDFDL